eukprot:gene25609-34175_t
MSTTLPSSSSSTPAFLSPSQIEDDNNLRGEIVLSFYDRKEVKEYFGFVTRHEQIYFERWKIAIVLVEEKPQSNNSNASLLKEQQYQSAYDQLSAIVLSIIESVNAASDHLPLALYDYEMTIMEPPTPSTDFSGIPLFFSLYGSPFTATCSKNRFCPPEIYMGRMLSDETKAIGYVTPGELVFPNDMTDEWELDCYSRPVIGEDGKKLWELLLTDSESRFRYLKPIPSNLVNSRNVRKIVEDILEQSPVRPKSIRFFRNQMFNMINIALSTLDVDVKPSRRTTSLYMWLQEREENVYPLMAGYNPQLKQQTILDYDVTQPDRLPDVFKAESYAFVALPSEVFWDGQVNAENIKKGRLCPIRDMPRKEGTWVHGINLYSKRAAAVAAWMNGLEIAFLKADLIGRELLVHTDIRTQLILAPLMDAQKKEAQMFEKGKAEAAGYHFISVQSSPDSEEVEGFWLLRQFSDSL